LKAVDSFNRKGGKDMRVAIALLTLASLGGTLAVASPEPDTKQQTQNQTKKEKKSKRSKKSDAKKNESGSSEKK
jgi:hypothetical protein